MNLMRWNPWSDIETLSTEMQRMLENRMAETGLTTGGLRPFTPNCDIYEANDRFILKFDLPEVRADDVHVDVENQTLTVRGERKLEQEEKKSNYHRIERSYGAFSRSFSLPTNVNGERIQATTKDGVLRIELPKKPEAQARKITVKPVD
jgi:HSP20 family protein